MINCKKCGFPCTEEEKVCLRCGASLEDDVSNEIFGEDILKPIEVTNLEDNAKIEEPVKPIENVVNNNLVSEEKVPSIEIPREEKIDEKEITISNPVEMVGSIDEVFKEPTTLENNKVNKLSEPFDLKKTLMIVGGIVLASLILLVTVVIFTNSKASKYNGQTSIVVDKDYKINFSGYDITIPASLAYEIDGDSLIVKEKNEKWMTIIQVSNFNYSKLLVNKEKIKASYEAMDMVVSNMIEKKYNDITFLTSEITKADTNMVLGITKASTDQSFVVISLNKEYTTTYDGLNNVASMLNKASYTGVNKSSNIKSDFFDFSQIKG